MRLFLLCGLLLASGLTVSLDAQSIDFNDVRRAYNTGSGAVVQGDQVRGYYALYQVDKAKGGDRVYQLELLDADLNKLQEQTLTRPNGTVALEAKFNGEAICLTLINLRKRTIELITYDRTGKKLGQKMFEPENRAFMTLQQMYNFNEEDGGAALVRGVPMKGFVFYLPTSDKGVRYTMHYLPNNLKGGWNKPADLKRGKFQFAASLTATEDYIVTNVTARPKAAMVKGTINSIEVRSVADGSVVGDFLPGKGSPRMNINNAFYEPESKTFMLGGMYYSPSADLVKDESTGVAIQRISPKGERLESAKVSWTKAFASVGRKKTEHLKKGGSVYLHRLVTKADGGITAIGEYYDDEVSAMGVAGALLGGAGGGGSNISLKKIVLQDLFAFNFDGQLEFADARIYSKPKRSVELASGSEFLSPARLAQLLDASDAFDYEFMQSYTDRGQTVLAYTTFEPQKGKMFKQPKFNLITEYDDEEEPVEKTLDFRTGATFTTYSEGKPGYVMVTDYLRKEKRLSLRLEPVD